MEEKEFTSRLTTIQNIVKVSNSMETEITAILNRLIPSVKNVIKLNKQRDEILLVYLGKQKELGFSDNLTSPSDLFPGIRTAIEMSDPEEMLNLSEELKDLANKITSNTQEISQENRLAINSLKQCIAQLSEYILQKEHSYDTALELLKDADSIYDVGQLASNT